MTKKTVSFRYFNSSPEGIGLVVKAAAARPLPLAEDPVAGSLACYAFPAHALPHPPSAPHGGPLRRDSPRARSPFGVPCASRKAYPCCHHFITVDMNRVMLMVRDGTVRVLHKISLADEVPARLGPGQPA